MSASPSTSSVVDVDAYFISTLIGLLSQERADNYLNWMGVGRCLYNIQFEHPHLNLLQVWIEFTSRSSKFEESECEKIWSGMEYKAIGTNIGSLCMWAEADNNDGYVCLIG